jgi:hypothetical protein
LWLIYFWAVFTWPTDMSGVLLTRLQFLNLSAQYPVFYRTRTFLPCWQEPLTNSYPTLHKFIPHLTYLRSAVILLLFVHKSPIWWSFFLVFSSETTSRYSFHICPVYATWSSHHIFFDISTPPVFSADHNLWSSFWRSCIADFWCLSPWYQCPPQLPVVRQHSLYSSRTARDKVSQKQT